MGKYVSPPLSLPENFKELPFTYNDTMAPPTVQLRSNMASRLPRRPLRPNTPSVTTAPRLRQQHRQPHKLLDLRHRVLPFDFSATMQPSLAFPKDLKAFHYPPEQVIVTENYVPPRPNPLRRQSSEPVFFIDPGFRQDVAELFGYTVHGQDSSRSGHVNTRQVLLRTTGFHTTMRQAPPYVPNDGDALVWRKRLEGNSNGQTRSDDVKPAWNLSDTWPQWNFREDLELDYEEERDIFT